MRSIGTWPVNTRSHAGTSFGVQVVESVAVGVVVGGLFGVWLSCWRCGGRDRLLGLGGVGGVSAGVVCGRLVGVAGAVAGTNEIGFSVGVGVLL